MDLQSSQKLPFNPAKILEKLLPPQTTKAKTQEAHAVPKCPCRTRLLRPTTFYATTFRIIVGWI